MTPKFELGRNFCTMRLLPSYVYSFESYRVDKFTNKQTDAAENIQRSSLYAMTFGLWTFRYSVSSLQYRRLGLSQSIYTLIHIISTGLVNVTALHYSALMSQHRHGSNVVITRHRFSLCRNTQNIFVEARSRIRQVAIHEQ